MRNLILFIALLSCTSFFGQRIILPGQDILYPHLNDPSFVGENKRVEATGLVQIADSERKQVSQYLFAQFPVYENVSFGFDYFKDNFEFYSYSTAMVTTAIKFGLGNSRHYIKLGVSGGVDTRKQDRVPLWQLPEDEGFVPKINDANTDFVYRAGLHYINKNLSLGGFYNKIPLQSIVFRAASEDELHYLVDFGFTAYAQYAIRLSQNFRVTPIFRYLSYFDDPIYEGALRFDVKNLVSASVSYKNDYSINPAIRVRLFKALQLGYSYEKALGAMNFDDIHSISLSYRFKKQSGENGEEEPEWMENAKESIEKVEAIKEPKPKVKERKESKDKEEIQENQEAVEVNETTEKAEEVVTREPVIKEAVETVAASEIEEEPIETNEVVDDVEAEVSKKPVEEASPETVKETVEKTSKVETVKTKTAKTNYVVIAMSPRYYIIAGSFDTFEEASIFKNKLGENDHRSVVGKTDTSNKYYVYIDSDANENRALKKLESHKSNVIFKDALLLEVEK